LYSCNKKKTEPPVEEQPAPPLVETKFCNELPPAPQPFGWYDSTADENTNINAFIVNPVNGDEIMCIVNGDLLGYNKMYNYNVPSKTAKYIASIGNFLPSVNKNGWILFSTLDNNIFKVKTNGDSLRQLTGGNNYFNPQWDFTGKKFYYFQAARIPNINAQLMLADAKGALLASIPAELAFTAPFRNSDKLIYMKTKGNQVTMIQRDMLTQEEVALITGPYSPGAPFHFDDLTLDRNDEYLYWSNSAGVMRCSLKTLAIDTVLKNCQNLQYLNPLISFNANELTVGCHMMTPLNSYQLLHEYKAMELNLLSRELTEIRIFH
jgi:hypothetical protein